MFAMIAVHQFVRFTMHACHLPSLIAWNRGKLSPRPEGASP
jgi:hypothetical protein